MINLSTDVAVIGGGPGGLAAATSAKKHGAKNVIIIDRNNWLGGILPQCIHDGFGVEELGESLTGPEYAQKYVELAEEQSVNIMTSTMVLNFNKNKEILAINKNDLYKIKGKSIILAMGCREKTRWNAMIPGDRPSGIYTAGVAQAFINLYNIMPGRNVLVLGSGDVGLIMARRMKFEGANVLGVVEILPYASGLPRNVVQCLDDYDIPLFLNHTVTYIQGRERLESVTIAQIDANNNIIPGTNQVLKCDTLLLSLGLTPENELSKDAGVIIDSITGGPVVNQNFETNVKGIFACGNCLEVYDTVDMLSIDAKKAGEHAAKIKSNNNRVNEVQVKPGNGIRYVVPQKINQDGEVEFTIRSKKPCGPSILLFKSEKDEFFKKKLRFVNPANIIRVKVNISKALLKSAKTLEVSLSEK